MRAWAATVGLILVCLLIVGGCEGYRQDQCEAKGGRREYVHPWYERGKNEQKVCITSDGRIVR